MGTWVVQGVRAQGLGVVGDRLAYGKRGVRRRSPGPGVRGWAGIQSGTWARKHGGEAADKGGASRPKPPFPVQLLGALVPPRPHLPKVLLPAEPDSLSMRWAWASGRCSAGPNACRAVPPCLHPRQVGRQGKGPATQDPSHDGGQGWFSTFTALYRMKHSCPFLTINTCFSVEHELFRKQRKF